MEDYSLNSFIVISGIQLVSKTLIYSLVSCHLMRNYEKYMQNVMYTVFLYMMVAKASNWIPN